MKHLLLLSFAFTTALAFSQSAVIEPQFSEQFVALHGGAIVPLEHATATMHAGGGGFMVASSKAAYEIANAKSNVRFKSDEPLVFVVRSPAAQTSIDPSTQYMLRRLDSKKKTREIVIMTGRFSPFGGSTQTNLGAGQLPLTFARYGESSFKVSAGALPPGEYALSRAYGQELFCFGVD